MPAKKKNGHTNGVKQYGAYRFRDKDPAIDLTRTLFEDIYGERVNNKMLREVEKNGGPTSSCMRGWFFGQTRRPKNETLEASGRALGYQRIWVQMKKGSR